MNDFNNGTVKEIIYIKNVDNYLSIKVYSSSKLIL